MNGWGGESSKGLRSHGSPGRGCAAQGLCAQALGPSAAVTLGLSLVTHVTLATFSLSVPHFY